VSDLNIEGFGPEREPAPEPAPKPARVKAPPTRRKLVDYQVPKQCAVTVLGHAPGEKFKAEITPEQEARLMRRGQLRRVFTERPNERHNQSQEG
jgi:hypothetical protein